MAWAATIGLCLAIVIELANLPQPTSEMLALPDAVAPQRLESKAQQSIDSKAQQSFETEAQQNLDVEVLELRARKTVDDQGRVSLQNAPTLGKTEAPESALEPEPGLASDADTFRLQDAPVLEEAEAIARSREDNSKKLDAGSVANFSRPAAAARVPMPCEAEIRLTPETWLECIMELEDAGLDDMASRQREQLQESFPDFDLP